MQNALLGPNTTAEATAKSQSANPKNPKFGGLSPSQEVAENKEILDRIVARVQPKLRPKWQPEKRSAEQWRPVVVDSSRGRLIDMFESYPLGEYRWGAGRAKGQPAFHDVGDTIFSLSLNEWALATELELAISRVGTGEWKEIRAFGDEDYRRRVWAQAQAMGIDILGYKPTPDDLKRFRSKLSTNGLTADSHEVADSRDKRFEGYPKLNSKFGTQGDNSIRQSKSSSSGSVKTLNR